MEQLRTNGIGSAVLLFFLIFSLLAPIIKADQELWGNAWTGPWIDKLVFEVIQDDTQQVLALIDGDVDIIGGQIDPIYLNQLFEANNVQVSEIPNYGYGILHINCDMYPMNITSFRRALAFAMDKQRIIDEAWFGHAELLDCHVTLQHPAYIEEEMNYHYYERDLEKGKELLELAEFNDTDNDGWLEGPGPIGPGSLELDTIIVECSPTRQNYIYCDEVVQALLNLSINAEARKSSFDEYNPRLVNHEDYMMIISECKWSQPDLDSYARMYSSEYANATHMNPSNWINASWDLHADIILHSTDYNEILEAAKEAEYIWVEACPAIVLYQSSCLTAYRTDSFDGVIVDIFKGAPNFFTNLRGHKIEGVVLGGTYTWANPKDILSFNHFSSNSDYAQNILDVMYDPLVRIGPDGNDLSWMCQDFNVQTHSDNADVPEGHTRIIVDLIQNATWSDGTPITADDFAFTILFIHDNIPNFAFELEDLFACYSYSPNQLFCEFSSESYWHWNNIAYKSVIPSQVWSEYADAYDEYQPSPSTIDDMVISGPFKPSAWVQGDFVEMEQNPYYFKNPRLLELPTTETTTTTSITATSTTLTTSNTTEGITQNPVSSNYTWIWLIALIIEIGLCIYIISIRQNTK